VQEEKGQLGSPSDDAWDKKMSRHNKPINGNAKLEVKYDQNEGGIVLSMYADGQYLYVVFQDWNSMQNFLYNEYGGTNDN